MSWYLLVQLFSTWIELILLGRKTTTEKDLEILLLRRQLMIVERTLTKPLRISRVEKLTLAVLLAQLKIRTGQTVHQLRQMLRIFQPETVLQWHRDLVRRKWTFRHVNRGGRPRTGAGLEQLVLRLARENDWGSAKIQGELLKLGYRISDGTVRKILKRHGIPSSGERCASPGWRHLMTHYKHQLLACDFFTVETLLLQTVYVFFFIELGTRRVHFAGCTAQPNGAWVTQQGRQLVWQLEERERPMRFLIHDNDRKFTSVFNRFRCRSHRPYQTDRFDVGMYWAASFTIISALHSPEMSAWMRFFGSTGSLTPRVGFLDPTAYALYGRNVSIRSSF
jgi:putative transposase